MYSHNKNIVYMLWVIQKIEKYETNKQLNENCMINLARAKLNSIILYKD